MTSKNDLEKFKGNVLIEPEIIGRPLPDQTGQDKSLQNAVIDNFGTILEITSQIVAISQQRMATTDQIRLMEAARKKLESETEDYVRKKTAETDSIVSKMNIIRLMLQDFYASGGGQISSADFVKTITSILETMSKFQ